MRIIGLGPGGPEGLTEQAREALAECQVVIGYKAYLDQAGELLAGKEVQASTMTRELDRAGRAIELALSGRKVGLVSGGDPGVYGMAPVVFELLRQSGQELWGDGLSVEVVPGMPALAAAAAALGAPLSHDFACISLSDRLTPWELIKKRLCLTLEADMVVVLYNPKSKGRPWQFGEACSLALERRGPAVPVGMVRRAMRHGQEVTLTTLEKAHLARVDMQTLVIIGNSQSFTHQGRMVTPRGYLNKYRPFSSGEEETSHDQAI